jgi:hypothetical protein
MGRNVVALLLTVLVAAPCGCCVSGICTKRDNELCCPTDIRKTHFWCFGEDAIIHGPCGPKPELYGYEPTCWREFPIVPPCYCVDCNRLPSTQPPLNEAPATSPTEKLPPLPSQQNVSPKGDNVHPSPLVMPPLPPQGSALPTLGKLKASSVANAIPMAPSSPPKYHPEVRTVIDEKHKSPTTSYVSSTAASTSLPSPMPSAPVQPIFDQESASDWIGTLIPAPLPGSRATDETGDGVLMPEELPGTTQEASFPTFPHANSLGTPPPFSR